MKKIIRFILNRLRGELATEKYISNGMVVGKNFKRLPGCTFDISHCWLIEIGNDVTFAPNCKLIAHDASTKNELGYAVIGRITIGNNVFIGNSSVILPNINIGNNVIIGAGSVVTQNIPDNSVAVGNPAKIIISYEEYIKKRVFQMQECPVYEEEYTIRAGVSIEMKNRMKNELTERIGFVR